MTNHYFVVLISGPVETRISRLGLSSREAEAKRDRLNDDLARAGVKYGEGRYAVRLANEWRMAMGAAA